MRLNNSQLYTPKSSTKLTPYGTATLILMIAAILSVFAHGQSAQRAGLRGTVTDQSGAVIPSANVMLSDGKGIARTTHSDSDGSFDFGEVASGDYSLTVRKEGFADIERKIAIGNGVEYSDVQLAPGAVTETVTIVLDSAEAAAESTLKLSASLRETPRSLSVIGSERISEQNFRQVSDVLNYTPGTTQNSYRNGSYHFYSRGFRMGPEDTKLDGFSGINVGGGGFGASTFGIDQIVVLRGPASLVYGQTGAPGGLVNLISKRPEDRRFTRVDLRTAGYSGNGVGFGERPSVGVDVDSTGALTKGGRVSYRALLTAENMNYFTAGTLDRNQYANGSLLIKLDRDGRFVLVPAVQYTRYFRPYGGGIVVSPSSSLSLAPNAPDDPSGQDLNRTDLSPLDVNLFSGRRIEETAWAGLDLRGVVDEKLRFNAAYRYVSFNTDIKSFTPQATTAQQMSQLREQFTISRVQAKSLTERNYNNFNADASYEWLNTHFVRNTTQVGVYSRSLTSRATSPLGPIPAAQSPINVYTGNVNTPLIDNFPEIRFGEWSSDLVWNGFVQNRTSLDKGRWNLTLGVNYGENDPAAGAVRKSGVIPNASLVFNAMPQLAVYASYSTSFNPPDPTLEDVNGGTGMFEPAIGTNFEVGAKYDLFTRRVNLTFALFQNQIDNALVLSDAGVLNRNNLRYYIPTGTRRGRGAEFTGEFQVRHDLRISAGASYTEAIYKGLPAGAIASTSPIPNSWAEKTPRWSYNVYSRYDRREGFLKGLGAGLGLTWQGKRTGSNGARTFASPDPLVLPAFTRVDAALFYRLNKFVNFALNTENLFDQVIFVNASVGSNVEIAAPRTVTLRTSFNF